MMEAVGFIVAAVVQLLLFVLVVAALATFLARRSGRGIGGALKSIFRYGMLFVLMILSATGMTGLVALADYEVVGGPGYTAFMLACIIIGGPGLAIVARRVGRDLVRSGGSDPGFEIYLVIAELVCLVTAATGAYIWVENLFSGRFRVAPAAVMLVWGGVWYVHHALAGHRDRAGRLRYGVLLGSFVGLIVGAAFGVLLLQSVLTAIYNVVAGVTVIAGDVEPIFGGLIGVVIWGAVWLRYWWVLGMRQEPSPPWRAYVLLVGVVGGLVAFLTGVWSLAYRLLDWLVGDSGEPARLHFEELPLALALVAVGALAWRYHNSVLQRAGSTSRSEVDRLHDYVVAGVGLVATVSGLAAVIAASVGAIGFDDLLVSADRSQLVGAVTVLLVGAPLWWRYWTMAQEWRHEDPDSELLSPTRRIFLVIVFGAGGVIALGSLFFLAYRVIEALLGEGFGARTVYAVRWPLALVATVGMSAAYHRVIRRADLSEMPLEPPAVGVRSVVLVGSGGREVAREVEKHTGIKARTWERADMEEALSAEAVVEAIASADHSHLLIVARPEGQEVIPYRE